MGFNFRLAAGLPNEDEEGETDAGSVDRRGGDLDQATGPQEPESVAGDETPAACSYCGSAAFTDLTDNGRVRQATCVACGGTMSAHPGAQWTPELIGDPSNHPKPNPDPRSGGVGGAGAAATDPLVRDHSRLGVVHVAKPGDDEHVEGKMGLPLLQHGESYEDRLGKLTHHYTFLHNDDETNQSYMESRHPLARHHEAHGVPHFNDNDHITEAPDVKARIAAHLSRHLEKNPPKNPPNVSVVLPEHTATMTKHTYADYSPSLGNEYSTSQIRVNRKLARRPEDSPHVPGGTGVPRPSRDWFAADDGSSSLLGRVLTHEHGHLRDEEAHNGISTDDHNNEGIKRREKMFEEVSQHIPGATQYKSGSSTHHWLLDNREHIINHVSTYAAQDDKEFVAELYAHHHHSPNPSKAANVVARYLDGEHHDHGSTDAGEAGSAAVRPAAEGKHPGGPASHREGDPALEGAFRGRLAKLSAVDGPDWCTWRQAAQCTFPNDRNSTLLAIPQVRGACPWTTRYAQQICPISEPGPMALMQRKGASEDWRGHHRPPGSEDGIPAHDLTNPNGELSLPEDVYTHPHRYGDMSEPTLQEAHHVLKQVRNKPDASVTVYRSLPAEHAQAGIQSGDWVSLSKGWAQQFHPESPVISATVPAKHLHTDADDLREFGYNGPPLHHKTSAKALSWDEIGDRHPHVYGDSEIHGDAADGADGPGIGDATNYLAHERPGHQDAEDSSVHDLDFHEETVHPRHIDFKPSGANDPRVSRAREGYQQHPEKMPPLVLVKRHNVYQVADGHHRAEAAHGLDMPVRAYVAHSPHNDEPFADDERGPFHGAEPISKGAAMQREDLNDMGSLSVPQSYELARVARQDPEMAFHVTAAWSDVRSKAKRIRAEGKVQIKVATNEGLAGEVQGDHGTYENMITYRPGTRKIADWQCDCKWGEWAWDRIRFHGRQCSHSLALQYEAQSRGMFGREVHLGALKFGHVEEVDERPGLSDAPITLIARSLTEADEDPADIIKILMAYGLTHSAAHQLLLPAKESSIQVEADQEKMCQQCGHMLEEDAKRCPVCSAEIEDDFKDTFHDAAMHEGSRVIAGHDPVYLRFGHWPDDERSHNNVTGFKEEGVSVYDLDHHGHPMDPDPDFSRGHEHDEHCEPDCNMHLDNEDYGNDTREEMEGRVHRAERNRYSGTDRPSETGHLVRGEMVGIGHDGEPLLQKVKRVGDWIDHRHHFIPGAEPHRLARHPQDEDYEPPKGMRHTGSANLTENEEKKRRKKHHDTADARRHAPNFGYGVPGWIGLPIGWCGQCSGSGCGHCGGTGQVAQDGNGNTANPVPDQNGDEGEMMSGGISETSSLRTAKDSHKTLYRGLHLGGGEDHEAEALHADPVKHFESHARENTGVHWTENYNVAKDFALNRHPDGTVFGFAPHNYGVVLESSVHPDHIVDRLSDEGHQLSREHGGIYLPDHREQQTTVRPGSPVPITHVHGVSIREDGTDERQSVGSYHGHERTASTAAPYYHGTTEEGLTHILPSSQHGGHVLYPGAADAGHAYATTDPAEAWNYAKTKYHNTDHGVPRVYQVEPLHGDHSHVEADPNFKDDISFRSPQGFQVAHELPMPDRMRESGHWGEERPEDPWAHLGSKQDGPTVSGVALKAADTNRVLMLQRGLGEDHPAAGKWEFPGGHHEEGDKTSLHAGIREWEEEVGQPFPEGGVVHHTWTSPDGGYQGHVVVIPSEKDVEMHQGRVVPNPDDPKGDEHEQAAWWDIDHAKGNKVLRDEVKAHTPWKDIAKAGTEKTASSWDALSGEDDTPGFPYAAPQHSSSENPASTGWATSEDPKSWTNATEIPDHLLPESSYYGMLHDEPEGALPSTDGADEDGYQPPETQSSIADTESSALPNQFTGSISDIVASFQATAGAKGIMEGTSAQQNGGEMSFDYTAAARQYLAQGKGLQKSALKDFSFPEQQELINEGKRDDVRARNFNSLQIEGTHYEALNRALGLDNEDAEELFT